MRVTTVREEPDPFFLSDIVFAKQQFVGVRHSGTLEGGTQLGGSLVIVALGTQVVLFVGPELITHRGFWLDYQWRLRVIAPPLLTLLAPLESCVRSSV